MDDDSGPHGPVWSISLHRFRERVSYADGDRGRSGAQAFEHFVDVDLIDSVGGELVLGGPIIQTRRGEPWDRLVVSSLPGATPWHYPSIEAYEALDAHPTWRAASDRLQADAKNCYEMLMAPTINRLANSLH